ncbi:hypothetical protein [Rhizomonospora bruguierae]|uniref:hypothetical protein n=1 Tax=Rhizomonospora bruguierae TaxID=1581705 RepID=UPI001BD1AE17|nr:hypothetical protein [Micromonospora sp. NBRC 107566]
MLGTHGTTKAEKIARSVSKATGVADVGEQVGAVKDEARRRTTAALNALSGRRPAPPLSMLLAATAAGLAIGWVAATALRRAMAARNATVEPVYGVAEVEEPIEPLR